MRIKKSKLKSIILEEIERDIISEFKSEQETRDEYVAKLTDDDPENDKEVPADFRKGFFAFYNPAKYAVDTITGDFEYEPGEEPEVEDQEQIDDIMAAYALYFKKGFSGAIIGAAVGEKATDIISAGYAIAIDGRDTFQIFDSETWPKGKTLDNTQDLQGNPLSGCEAAARVVIAGVLYRQIYKAYNFTLSKLTERAKNVAIMARLARVLGARRMKLLALGLTTEDAKIVLSLAFTIKLMRDHAPTAAEITKLQDEFCGIKDFSTAYDAVENTVIRFITGVPAFAVAIYNDLLKSLATGGSSRSTPTTPSSTPSTDGDKKDGGVMGAGDLT